MSNLKLDILAIGVHPDDVELGCSGTILKEISLGKEVGLLDLTQGELGTRGSAEIRLKEAEVAAKILGVKVRDNLAMQDAFFENNKSNQLKITSILRKYKPDIVLANAIEDRHPDHGRASKLISDACFYSGLRKVKTQLNGKEQEAWRPKVVYHYIQDRRIAPNFIVDVSQFAEQKIEAIKAYKSQFYNPDSNEPESPISSANFFNYIKGRMADTGRYIGVDYAEGFTVERPIAAKSLDDIY